MMILLIVNPNKIEIITINFLLGLDFLDAGIPASTIITEGVFFISSIRANSYCCFNVI